MSRALEEAAEWIVRLNDTAATEADFAAWQAWLGRDPAHAPAFQEVQDTWRRSASVAKLCTPEVRESMGEVGRCLRYAPYAMAASIGVALMALGAFFWPRTSTIETAVTELRSLTLPDGTQVSLGPKTALEVKFSAEERVLTMRGGEAFFQVARMPDRPFRVHTPKGSITALGTAFSVHTNESRLAIAVTDGKVKVEWEAHAMPGFGPQKPSTPLVLVAGQKYVQDGDDARTSELSSMADAIAWREGRLEYEGESLQTVISDLNRYSRLKLRLQDPRLRELRYTGTVFPDTLDVWLDSLEGVFPLRVEKSDGERRIVAVE